MATTDPQGRLLGVADDALADGDRDRAVEVAYAVVRGAIQRRLALPEVATHWEFYGACQRAGLNGEGIEALGRLTELYERAAFAPAPVEPADAEWAVEVAASFAERQRSSA